MWLRESQATSIQVLVYKKLAQIAEKTDVEVSADLCDV